MERRTRPCRFDRADLLKRRARMVPGPWCQPDRPKAMVPWVRAFGESKETETTGHRIYRVVSPQPQAPSRPPGPGAR